MRKSLVLAIPSLIALITGFSFYLSSSVTAKIVAENEALVRPIITQPSPGQSMQDVTFGHTVTRLSDSTQHLRVKGQNRYILKTDYSRVQAENSDGTLLLTLAANSHGILQYSLLSTNGGKARLIDLPNNNPSGLGILHDQTEARWHPQDPHKIRFIKGQNSYVGDLRVFELDLQKKKVKVLADLTGKLPKHWGNRLYGMTYQEGGYSADGNRAAWAVELGDGHAETPVGYVAFDLRNGGEILGTKDYDKRRHDNISISPSGQYVVIASRRKTSVFPVDFSKERVIAREAQHSDICTTATGEDCYLSVSFNDTENPDYGWVYMEELASAKRSRLLNIFGEGNTSIHFSAKASKRPGWALISTFNCAAGDSSTRPTRLCDRVSLIELKANPQIIPLAWAHSRGEHYYAEPQASLNSDGTRAYFNSDWGKHDEVDIYRIDIPTSIYGE